MTTDKSQLAEALQDAVVIGTEQSGPSIAGPAIVVKRVNQAFRILEAAKSTLTPLPAERKAAWDAFNRIEKAVFSADISNGEDWQILSSFLLSVAEPSDEQILEFGSHYKNNGVVASGLFLFTHEDFIRCVRALLKGTNNG